MSQTARGSGTSASAAIGAAPPDRVPVWVQVTVLMVLAIVIMAAPLLVPWLFGWGEIPAWTAWRRAGHVLAANVVLSLFLLAIFLLIYGQIGRGYGITSLFWNDRFLTRLCASTAVTVYLGLVLTASFVTDHGGTKDLGEFLRMTCGLLLVLVIAPAAAPSAFPYVPRSVLRVLVKPDGSGLWLGNSPDVTRNGWGYTLGLIVWLGGVMLGVGALDGAIVFQRKFVHFHGFDGGPLAIWLGSFVLLYLVLNLPPLYRWVSPPVAICALLGLLAIVNALTNVMFERMPLSSRYLDLARLTTFVVLAGLFTLVNGRPFKLRFPMMEMYYPGTAGEPVDLRARVTAVYDQGDGYAPQHGNSEEAELVADDVVLDNWVREMTGKTPEEVAEGPPAQRPKLAIVAVSGGATRSGFWSAVVLDRIETLIPDFGKHVRIITGASGGMLGAGYYLIYRASCTGGTLVKRPRPWREAVYLKFLATVARYVAPLFMKSVMLRGDKETAGAAVAAMKDATEAALKGPSGWLHDIPRSSIDPIARFIALRDPWLAWLPRPIPDRGIELENDWKALGVPLQSLLPWERQGKIPSMILSPMIVDDGRRLLISNLDLWELTWEKGSALAYDSDGTDAEAYSLSALEFFRLFPQATKFKLATGVRMSASFPYVSPSVNLPCQPPRRVVDAGYYDNYGVQVAAAWTRKNRGWLVRHTSGVVLVQVRDSISQKDRMEIADAPTGFWARVARGFHFFTSPPEGVASARNSSTMFRNDQDVADLCETFDTGPDSPAFFTTVGFENSASVTFDRPEPGTWPGDGPVDPARGDVPLDWYLSMAETAGLMGAIPSRPAPTSKWANPDQRRQRILELQQKADTTSGPVRDAWLKQLEQAKNYERLVRLEAWWNRCHVDVSVCSHNITETPPEGQGH